MDIGHRFRPLIYNCATLFYVYCSVELATLLREYMTAMHPLITNE